MHICILLCYVVCSFYAYDNIFFQNENVNREASSSQMYLHARHPNRLAETRVLVEKTFKFSLNSSG